MAHYDIATIATLTATQARAVAKLVNTPTARRALRDAMLGAAQRTLPAGSQRGLHAAALHDLCLVAQDQHGPEAVSLIHMVCELSPGGLAPGRRSIERSLARCASKPPSS